MPSCSHKFNKYNPSVHARRAGKSPNGRRNLVPVTPGQLPELTKRFHNKIQRRMGHSNKNIPFFGEKITTPRGTITIPVKVNDLIPTNFMFELIDDELTCLSKESFLDTRKCHLQRLHLPDVLLI